MKIKWLGHSCFILTSENGTKILTDPFDSKVGYILPQISADIVTTSHDHYDHNNIKVVKSKFNHINKSGRFSVNGITIKGVQAYHDNDSGARRGRNILYIFDIDEIRVCHCGDLGHILTGDQVEEIGQVDVLLLPVGGTFTIDSGQALEVMKLLNPAVTIPMHYKTSKLTFALDEVDKFLTKAGKGEHLESAEIRIVKSELTEPGRIIVLNNEA